MNKKVISKMISLVLTIAMICSCVLTSGMTAVFAEDAVTMSLSTASDVIGNNFYADKMPMFNISLNGSEGTYDVVYKAFDKNDEVVWSKTDKLSVGTTGIAKESVSIDEPYFGVMKFEAKLYKNGAEKGSAETYYSLSNHRDDMPHNMRSGAVSQVNWYSGSEDAHVSLLNGAGLGYLRSNDLAWGNIEIEKGKFSLVDDNVSETEATKNSLDRIKNIRKLLDGLEKNDLKYIALLGVTNPLYNPSNPYAFGGTDEEYARLTEYAKYLAEQTEYPVDILEVTNEWHSSDMTNSVENSADANMLAKIHKAIYDGVQSASAENKLKVSGIDEDSWGLYGGPVTQAGQAQNGMIPKYIDAMQSLGVKPYDYVSSHPYAEATTPFEISVRANTYINELKALLESEAYGTGGNYMAPFVFSEVGWNNEDGVTEEQQAAWLVRANAYIQQNDMAEIVCNYHIMDYAKDNKKVGYGLVNDMTTGGERGIPYLAKEAYVAMAYYNSLMAYANQDDIALVDVDASDDDYCYNFAPAEAGGERVLMYGLKTEDAEPVTKLINVGVDKVTLADMYGNERAVETKGGVIELVLDDTPDYVKGNFNTVTVASGYAEKTAGYVVNDMEDATKLAWYQNTPSKNGALYGIKADDPDKGNVFHTYSVIGDSKLTKYVRPMVNLPERANKVLISFDAKTDVVFNEGYLMVQAVGTDSADSAKKSYTVARLADTAKKSWVYNNWQTKATDAPIEKDKWVRIDIVLDMVNENVVVYKNGAKIDGGNKTSGSSFPNLTDVSQVFIDCYTEISDGATANNGSFYIDNFAVTPFDEVGDIPAKINVWNNNTVYVNLPATLSNDSVVSATGNKLVAADGSEISATAELIGKTGVKLNLDGEIADNKEYKVVFGKSTILKNFINGEAVGEIKINKNTATMHKTVIDTSFDEEIWKSITPKNLPENIEFDPNADNGDMLGVADGTNNVLMFRDQDDAEYVERIKFNLGDIPETKIKLRLDYKAKLIKAQDTDIYGTFYSLLWDEDSSASEANRQTSGIGTNFKYNNNPLRGIDYYTGGSAWANSGAVSLVDAAKVSLGDWYTYNNEFILEECETYKRPTANYSVSDKDGYGVNSVINVNTCNPTIDWANMVYLDYMSVDGQADDMAYLDDLYIGYSYVNMAEPVVDESGIKAYLVMADGSEDPADKIAGANAVGLKLVMANAPSGEVTATLSDGCPVTVAKLAEGEYLIKWNGDLSGAHTLTVNDGEATIYTYNFTKETDKGYAKALLTENNFDSEESDFNKPSTTHTWRDNGALNGKALYLANNGDANADAINPRFLFDETKDGGRMLVSFDVAIDSAVTTADMSVMIMGETTDGMALVLKKDGETIQNWLYNNWNAGYRIAENFLTSEMRRVDVLYDFDDDTATIYLDGVLIKSENDVYGTTAFDKIKGIYMRVGEGIYIDNVRVIDPDEYMPEVIRAKTDGENTKVMYAELGTTLGEDYEGSGKLLNIDRGAEFDVTITGEKGSGFLQVVSPADIDFSAGYSLDFEGETPIDILGRNVKDSSLIAYFGSSYIEKAIAVTDFSGNNLLSDAVLFASDGTAATNADTAEVSDGVFKAKASHWLTGMKYTIPTNLPETYTLKVSYKTKLIPETGTSTYGGSYLAIGNADKITNASVAAGINYSSSGGFTYANNGQYWDTKNALVNISALDEWYICEYEFKVDGDKKPVGSYKVKNENGTVIGEVYDKEVNKAVTGRAEALWFGHRPVNTKAGSAALFDDIKISYVYEDEDINKFAFADIEGNEFEPSYNPDKLVSGISLGFNENISAVSVSMTAADGTSVPVTCSRISDYRWKVNVPLINESKAYTLKVIYGEKVFEYEFKPLSASGVIVSDFGVFQNNVKLSNMDEVIVPATLKAQAKLYDFTGGNASATLICAVYQDDMLIDITYIPATATETGEPVEKEFSISDKNGVTVKALLWKDVSGTIEPLAEGVHLK